MFRNIEHLGRHSFLHKYHINQQVFAIYVFYLGLRRNRFGVTLWHPQCKINNNFGFPFTCTFVKLKCTRTIGSCSLTLMGSERGHKNSYPYMLKKNKAHLLVKSLRLRIKCEQVFLGWNFSISTIKYFLFCLGSLVLKNG